jgi:hypothetical protein
MTGRSAGYCTGNDTAGYARGGGGGRGRGRGHRHVYHQTGLPRWQRGGARGDELEALRREAEILEERLGSVNRRIRDLETGSGKDDG